MVTLVRVLRGSWIIANYGKWEFRSDPSDFGYGITVEHNDGVDSVTQSLRSRYYLEPTTPIRLTYRLPAVSGAPFSDGGTPSNITTDHDVTMFMALQFCYPELTLCVTVGAEAVATYEFNCRSLFTVGRQIYLAQTDDPDIARRNLAEYNARGALEQIFSEVEMVVMHRVHLEMIYSNPIQSLPNWYPGGSSRSRNEIIVLDGGEDCPINTHDGVVPVIQEDIMLTQVTASDTTPFYGDLSINPLDSFMQTTEQGYYGNIAASRAYWDNLLTQGNLGGGDALMEGVLYVDDNPNNRDPQPMSVHILRGRFRSNGSGDGSSTVLEFALRILPV